MLRLRTFGGLTLERDSAPCSGPATQRRRLALLALLAASDGGVARERLRSYLWPDADELVARHSLDDALSALRRELRCPGLVIGVTTLRLNPELISSDLADLAAAIRTGDAETAAALCTGPFLDGFLLPDARDFEWWVEAERMRRSQAHERVLDGLAAAASARGDTAAAVHWRQARVALDRLDTPATLRLLAALTAHGRVHQALRVARSHERFVCQELDAAPGAGWTAAVADLRRGLARPPATPAASSIAPLVVDVRGRSTSRRRLTSSAAKHPVRSSHRSRNRWLRCGSLRGASALGERPYLPVAHVADALQPRTQEASVTSIGNCRPISAASMPFVAVLGA